MSWSRVIHFVEKKLKKHKRNTSKIPREKITEKCKIVGANTVLEIHGGCFEEHKFSMWSWATFVLQGNLFDTKY